MFKLQTISYCLVRMALSRQPCIKLFLIFLGTFIKVFILKITLSFLDVSTDIINGFNFWNGEFSMGVYFVSKTRALYDKIRDGKGIWSKLANSLLQLSSLLLYFVVSHKMPLSRDGFSKMLVSRQSTTQVGCLYVLIFININTLCSRLSLKLGVVKKWNCILLHFGIKIHLHGKKESQSIAWQISSTVIIQMKYSISLFWKTRFRIEMMPYVDDQEKQ